MGPSRIASELRRVASGIDASRRPSCSAVGRDLRRVLAVMESEDEEGVDFTEPTKYAVWDGESWQPGEVRLDRSDLPEEQLRTIMAEGQGLSDDEWDWEISETLQLLLPSSKVLSDPGTDETVSLQGVPLEGQVWVQVGVDDRHQLVAVVWEHSPGEGTRHLYPGQPYELDE